MRTRIDFRSRTVVKEATLSKRKKSLKFGVWLSIIVLMLFGLWKFVSYFRIQAVTCIYDDETCPQEYQAKVDSLHGKLFLPNQISGLEGYETTFKRSFPHDVQIKIKKPLPVVIVQTSADTTQRLSLISSGYILSSQSESDDILPKIIDERLKDKKVGDKLDTSVIEFYKGLKSSWTSRLSDTIGSIIITDDIVRLVGKSDFDVLLTVSDIHTQLLSLQEILGRPTIDIKHKEIDLRFQHPVIRDRGRDSPQQS